MRHNHKDVSMGVRNAKYLALHVVVSEYAVVSREVIFAIDPPI